MQYFVDKSFVKEYQAWEGTKMSSKKTFRWLLILIVISLLLASCAGSPAQPTPVPIPPTATPIPPTVTPIPSPTSPPTPTAIPGTKDPLTAGNFKFQITEVRIADAINNLPGNSLSNYKGALVKAANGFVPQAAQPGDMLLIVLIKLQTGDKQSFLDSDLKIIEGDTKKSAVAILTLDEADLVVWVYDVKPSSKSFLLVFPDDIMIDLTPLIP